ncbi:MAG: putative sulfate/molybdate transporter [Anaerolineae bacterium]|nr:putative sulfate/molybdate transporter [Anaerolineae bacterium]
MPEAHQAHTSNTGGAHPDFEFNLRELGGSLGDFGTLFPLAVGYIAVNGLDPAGLFVMLGLTNIALGLVYRLPMPLQPKKVIAAVAIGQGWSPSLVYASGFGMGLTWFLLIVTGLLRKLIDWTPGFLVRGIQLALGLTLGWQALRMMAPAPLLGLLAIAIVLLLRRSRYAPASVVLILLGVGIAAWRGDLAGLRFAITPPPLTVPRPAGVWRAMLLAGFAQIPLSVTNAVMATATTIRDYFPEKAVSERKLMLNMGVMNVAASFFGGMPVCHGAGGLAAQYYFGARTGGTPIMEGLIEVAIGLFLSRSIAHVMQAFPMALVGGMLLLVGIQLGLPALKLRGWGLVMAMTTAAVSAATNIGVGFLAGLGLSYLVRALRRRDVLPCLCPSEGDEISDDVEHKGGT